MKKPRNRRYIWYVEPLDPQTNAAIAGVLPEEDAIDNMRCENGMLRDVWRCKRSCVTRLLAARTQLKLTFRIFRREGDYGKIREWTFEQKPTHRKAVARSAA